MGIEQVVLGVYWLIAAFSFVWNSEFVAPGQHPIRRFVSVFSWIFLICLLIVVSTRVFRSDRFLVCLMPVLFAGAGLGYLIRTVKVYDLRFSMCAVACAVFVGVYNFVLYFEPLDAIVGSCRIDLMHDRYLEYLRSLVWLVITGVIGYLVWELNWAKERMPDPNGASQAPVVLGMLQLFWIFVGGLIATGYAFTVKLAAMECVPPVSFVGW